MKKGTCSIGLLALTLGIGFRPNSAGGAELVAAEGGDLVYETLVEGDVPYRVHVFTNTVTTNLRFSVGGAVDVMVVAGGGGGGGAANGGGGGAGGFIMQRAFPMPSGAVQVTVGAGGAGGGRFLRGATGGDSVFSSLKSGGGGGGGAHSSAANGLNGGSGGGASGYGAAYGLAWPSGQGHRGGIGGSYGGGGGGGAGTVGGKGTAKDGGGGGAGLICDLGGTPRYYAGGGGGAAYNGLPGTGGRGGGGAGGPYNESEAQPGAPNTGGGGGGIAGAPLYKGAPGGSGIVIVRYQSASLPFERSTPFTLADIVTGSTDFTSSNEVEMTDFPVPAGCDLFQLSIGEGGLAAVDSNAWQSVEVRPSRLTFATPVTDTNVFVYAWFMNSTEPAAMHRAAGQIYYTTVAPIPSLRATLVREKISGEPVVIYGPDLDAGSTGGEANGQVLAVTKRVALAANAGDDLTPGQPFVTVAAPGNYPLLLQVQNEAVVTRTSVATCMVTVVASATGTNTWTGLGASDSWDEAANWSGGVPAAGQDVAVRSDLGLQLSGPTAPLASFTLANGITLRVEGWESALTATNMTLAGTISHSPQTVTEPDPITGEWVPQHRVWLQGSNLTVSSTGSINVDYAGYTTQAGPGRAIHGLTYGTGGGGGYGGTGSSAFDGQMPGPATGDPADPWQPGSGGGLHKRGYVAGGGAIRVDMQGLVQVDGTMSACGREGNYDYQQPAASGGGIFIRCHAFQGAASGLVRADGGRGHQTGGCGGGGRIALHYDAVAQAEQPQPFVRFSAYAWQVSRLYFGDEDHWATRAQMGTLYLTDLALLSEAPQGDVVLDGQRFWHTRLVFGNDAMSWAPSSLTISNCVVGFPEGFELNVGGDLLLGGGGAVNPLTGTLQGGLHLYAAATNTLYGAQLKVGRDLTIGSDSWLYPYTEGTSAAIVGMQVVRNVTIAAGGGIDANEKGYLPKSGNSNGTGAGVHGDSGGSYGGLGGGSAVGQTYGLAALPLEAGSPGGWRARGNYYTSGNGGGAIHLLAGGAIQLDGLLCANASKGFYLLGPAGSGGSIFLTSMRFSGSGTLQAKGGGRTPGDDVGASPDGRKGSIRSPGGGGRIAIWHHLPLPVVQQRLAEKNVAGLLHAATDERFSGVLDTGVIESTLTYQPEEGTAGFYTVGATLIILR